MLENYVLQRLEETGQIGADRRQTLDEVAARLAKHLHSPPDPRPGEAALPITFVCTHNSRRSHLAQIWAQVAAWHFGLHQVTTYSGGTAATAFEPRAVAALRRAGFDIEVAEPGTNPVYEVRANGDATRMRCRSKVYSDAPNPRSGFVAVITCSSAEAECPTIQGAADQVSLLYRDPKAFDGTDREVAGYDERCAQIAREMLYLFRRLAST